MKPLALISIISLLTSCGKTTIDNFYKNGKPERKSTDKTFLPYLDELYKDVGSVKSVVVFGNASVNESWVGKCTRWSNSSYKEITIDRKYWNNASEGKRYQLLLHEIGHCKYNKGHNDEHTNKCPNSIMRSYVFFENEIDNCFFPNYNNYIVDLKS